MGLRWVHFHSCRCVIDIGDKYVAVPAMGMSLVFIMLETKDGKFLILIWLGCLAAWLLGCLGSLDWLV